MNRNCDEVVFKQPLEPEGVKTSSGNFMKKFFSDVFCAIKTIFNITLHSNLGGTFPSLISVKPSLILVP